MKKKIRIVIAVILSFVIGFLAYKITNKLKDKKEVAERIKNIPNFSFYNLKGETFTQNNLLNKPVIFIYFNSDCDFCKSEATKIQERLTDFKDAQLIFISFEEKETIQEFALAYKLDNEENVLFLEDKKAVFSELFDVKSIPYIVVYNKNKELLKKFKGVTKIDEILSVLK